MSCLSVSIVALEARLAEIDWTLKERLDRREALLVEIATVVRELRALGHGVALAEAVAARDRWIACCEARMRARREEERELVLVRDDWAAPHDVRDGARAALAELRRRRQRGR